jgi:TonB family protein
MKLTMAISLAAHAVVLGGLSLLNARLPAGAGGLVIVALVAPAASPREPLPTTTRLSEQRTGASAPRPRVHHKAPVLPAPRPSPSRPAPVESAPPPVVPQPEETDEPEDAEETDEPRPEKPAPPPTRPNLARDPELAPGSCTRGLVYPAAVQQITNEVVVRLRLALDDKGRVSNAWVVQRAGDSFDETALKAVREKCHFTAALDEEGRPIPFVIEDYRFHFRPAEMQTHGHFLMQ